MSADAGAEAGAAAADRAAADPVAAALPEAPPYWLRYTGRLVRFGSLDRPTRLLAVAASVAAILGLLVLVLPLARLPAVPMPGALAVVRVPWVVLVTASLLEAAGWCYLVAGAAAGGARVRVPVAVALVAFVVLAQPGRGPVLVPTLALAAYLVGTAWRPQAVALSRAVAVVGVGLIFALMLRAGAALYAITLLNETVVAYLLLVPIIFYSGYDLGQTALHGARLALLRAHGRVGVPALAAVVALVLVLKAILLWTVEHGPSPSFLLALPVLAVALLLSRRLAPEEERPHELMPALSALLILGGILGAGAMGRIWADAATVALVAGAVLAAGAWRGRVPAQAAVYLVVFGLWNLFNVITMRSGSPLALLARWPWPIDARGLDEAVMLAALAYGGWLALRRALTVPRLMLILFWLVGLSLVLGLWDVLSGLETLAHGALPAEAVLLAIGIGHEVAASGGLLNRGSRAVPRQSRVLLYLGYLLIVCGATVIADGSAGPTAGAIQADALQEGGLILVGVPLYLQMFAHALAVGRPPRRAAAAEGEGAPSAAAAEPVATA